MCVLAALAGQAIADATGVVGDVFALTLQIASTWVIAATLLWLWAAAAVRYWKEPHADPFGPLRGAGCGA